MHYVALCSSRRSFIYNRELFVWEFLLCGCRDHNTVDILLTEKAYGNVAQWDTMGACKLASSVHSRAKLRKNQGPSTEKGTWHLSGLIRRDNHFHDDGETLLALVHKFTMEKYLRKSHFQTSEGGLPALTNSNPRDIIFVRSWQIQCIVQKVSLSNVKEMIPFVWYKRQWKSRAIMKVDLKKKRSELSRAQQSQISCTVCVSKKTSGKKLISHHCARVHASNFLLCLFTAPIPLHFKLWPDSGFFYKEIQSTVL